MFCPSCGSEISDSSKFCAACGAPVTPQSAPVEAVGTDPSGDQLPAQPPVPPQDRAAAPSGTRSKGPIIAIASAAGVLVIALAAIAVFGFGALGGGPKSGVGGSASVSAEGEDGAAGAPKSDLDLSISQVDNAAFPSMTLYARIDGIDADDIDPALFTLREFDGEGDAYTGKIEQIVPIAMGDAMHLNLVVDQSGSMDDSDKMANAKSAANSFVDEIAGSEGTEAEITAFSDYVEEKQPFTSNTTLLYSAIASLEPEGGTALYDALYQGLQRTNLRSGSRVVIAFTDGAENASSYSASDVSDLSEQTGIPVYIVGIGEDVDSDVLELLATECGGKYFDVATTDLADALKDIYQRIYDEQRSLYKVTYTSTCDGDTSARWTIDLSCADDATYAGSCERVYTPVDNVSAYESDVNARDYVLPDSGSRAYSPSELEDLSLWELYLARNEIFARYGRGFKNDDLVEYFATKDWYQERYTPEQFSAMPTPLNSYELKNVDAMYQIEQERNSPYLYTEED